MSRFLVTMAILAGCDSRSVAITTSKREVSIAITDKHDSTMTSLSVTAECPRDPAVLVPMPIIVPINRSSLAERP